MSKKRTIKIPRSATLKCPHCGKNTRISLFPDTNLYFLDCKKCKQKIETPTSHCCAICAFSNKKCPSSLIIDAKKRNIEAVYQNKNKETQTVFTPLIQNSSL